MGAFPTTIHGGYETTRRFLDKISIAKRRDLEELGAHLRARHETFKAECTPLGG